MSSAESGGVEGGGALIWEAGRRVVNRARNPMKRDAGRRRCIENEDENARSRQRLRLRTWRSAKRQRFMGERGFSVAVLSSWRDIRVKSGRRQGVRRAGFSYCSHSLDGHIGEVIHPFSVELRVHFGRMFEVFL